MPKKRVLSDFMARELLSDYVSGRLDSDRKKAMDEVLASNEEIRDELEELRRAERYSELLGQTQLSQAYVEELNRPPPTWRDVAKKWRALPPVLRHSLEAVTTLAFVGAIVFSLPKKFRFWERGGNIMEFSFERQRPEPVTTDTKVAAATEAAPVFYGPPTTLRAEKAPSPTVQVAVAAAPQTITAPQPITAPKAPPVSLSEPAAKKTKGEIYRAFMASAEADKLTPEIAKKIESLGGERAGEVQLGWRRKGGSYFHFSLPESNREELLTYLQSFGPVRFVKESHPRVMPVGTIRIILWLEATAGNANNEEQTDGQ